MPTVFRGPDATEVKKIEEILQSYLHGRRMLQVKEYTYRVREE